MPGLRREEVALLAGVSIDYSVRLERGNLKGVSDTVLDSLAQALQLDAAERAHLRDLPLASNSGPRRRRPSDRQHRPPRHRRRQSARLRPVRTHVLRREKTPANIARFKFSTPGGASSSAAIGTSP
ncbi:helix-turn-helix domain-containing protein [Streptomyces longwoodensis]